MWAGSMQFRVSLMSPHLIVAVECSEQGILGYRATDLLGKTVGTFAGPMTDLEGFLYAVAVSAYQAATIQHVLLYDVDGVARNMTVSFAPSISQSCAITLQYSAAITLASVAEISTQAWALVSSDWPHFAESTNDRFAWRFGLSNADMIGQNLHRIKPRHTESRKWREPMHVMHADPMNSTLTPGH